MRTMAIVRITVAIMIAQGRYTVERIVGQRQLHVDAIKALFDVCDHQADYVVGLYQMALPNSYHWAQIDKLNGWPAVSKTTSNAIYGYAMAFDKLHHPNVIGGGAWMNNGFHTDERLSADWLVVWDVEYTLIS